MLLRSSRIGGTGTLRFKVKLKSGGGDCDVVPHCRISGGRQSSKRRSLLWPLPLLLRSRANRSRKPSRLDRRSVVARGTWSRRSSLVKGIACCTLSRRLFRDDDRHPRVLRAELVTDLLKHERYKREWDGLCLQGNKCDNFEIYCLCPSGWRLRAPAPGSGDSSS